MFTTLPDTVTGWRRTFEYAVQALILYSIVSFYVEVEISRGKASEGFWFYNEVAVTGLFTAEYLLRWFTSKDRRRYPFKPLAVIDLLAIMPVYLTGFVNVPSLRLVRTLRVLRLLKLYRYHVAVQQVLRGFRKVKDELIVVGFAVAIVVGFSSVAMYEFEHEAQPDRFGRLSDAVWWSLVTLTTVGYGDLCPITFGGRIIGALTMVLGIGTFGVFISLIGSSFIAATRAEEQVAPAPRNGAVDDDLEALGD